MSGSITPSEDVGFSRLPSFHKLESEDGNQCFETLKKCRPNTLDFTPITRGIRDSLQQKHAKRPNVLSACDWLQKTTRSMDIYSASPTSVKLSTCTIKRPSFLPIPSQGSSSSSLYPGLQKHVSCAFPQGESQRITSINKPLSPSNPKNSHMCSNTKAFIRKNCTCMQLPRVQFCWSFRKRCRFNQCYRVNNGSSLTWSQNNMQLYSLSCFDKFHVIHTRLFNSKFPVCHSHKRYVLNHLPCIRGFSRQLTGRHTLSTLWYFRRYNSYMCRKSLKCSRPNIQNWPTDACVNYYGRINDSIGIISSQNVNQSIESPVLDPKKSSDVHDILMKSSKKLSGYTNRSAEKVTSPTVVRNTTNIYSIPIDIDDANRVFLLRIDPLLTKNGISEVFSDNEQSQTSVKYSKIQTFSNEEEMWPPLVVSVHPELVLQYNPPTGLLMSLLEHHQTLPTNAYHRDASKIHTDLTDDSLHSVDSDVSMMPVARSEHFPKSNRIPPGITIALTRNLHIHVHPTELNCCLKQSAWCFTSSGFYQFGQEEIVILLRKRPDEKLPPLDIFYQYWLMYQALVNHAQKEIRSDVTFEMFSSQTYNKPFGSAPFRSHDCFFEKLYFASDRCSSFTETGPVTINDNCWLPSDLLSSNTNVDNNPYGFVFFHPTHQCLLGLHLPNPPFLIAVLVHIQEAPWAYRVPSRILLNMGKTSHFYPTTVLSDRDREVLFNCKTDEASFLQLFTNVTPFIYPDFMTVVSKQKSIIMPELLLHVNGFYAHLNVIQSEMESGNATATDTSEEIILELLLPTSSCVVLTKFLDTSPMESMTFALSADYNPMSDSHLVCSQLGKVCTEAVNSVCHIDTGFPSGIYSKTNSNRNYFPSQNRSKSFQTGAISIENTQPKITGVSFVAFSGHASCCSAVIIEDGVYIALTRSKFYQLVSSLKAGSDVSIQIQPNSRNRSAVVTQIHDDRVDDVAENQVTNADNVASSIHIKWFKVFDAFLSSASFSSTVTSPCYASSLGVWDLEPINTFLVPVHYQLSHWLHLNAGIISSGTNHFSSRPTVGSTNAPLLRLAWIRFHILNVQELEIIGTHSPKPLTFGHLANEVAECVTRALQPYLVHLRSNSRTQITLRIQLQSPDQVGYRMGASCQDVYTLHNQLQSSVDLETSDLEMKKNDEEIYADALDDVLLPVLSSWINCLRFVNQKEKEVKLSSPTTPVDDVGGGDGINENDIIQMEFDFCILD